MATQWAPIEGSDRIVQMRRLIWVFDGHTYQLAPFAGNQLNNHHWKSNFLEGFFLFSSVGIPTMVHVVNYPITYLMWPYQAKYRKNLTPNCNNSYQDTCLQVHLY